MGLNPAGVLLSVESSNLKIMKFKNNEIFQLFDKITCPGVYFLMNCDLKTNAIPTLSDEYKKKDKDEKGRLVGNKLGTSK